MISNETWPVNEGLSHVTIWIITDYTGPIHSYLHVKYCHHTQMVLMLKSARTWEIFKVSGGHFLTYRREARPDLKQLLGKVHLCVCWQYTFTQDCSIFKVFNSTSEANCSWNKPTSHPQFWTAVLCLERKKKTWLFKLSFFLLNNTAHLGNVPTVVYC